MKYKILQAYIWAEHEGKRWTYSTVYDIVRITTPEKVVYIVPKPIMDYADLMGVDMIEMDEQTFNKQYSLTYIQ